MPLLVLGLVIFLGVHCLRVFAPEFRRGQIAARGEGPWKGIYSVLSAIGLVLLIWGYGQARLDPVIFWVAPTWMAHVTGLLMIPAIVLLMAYIFPAGRIKAAVKHPMLAAVKIWALAHLLVNGDLASLILFGSFLAWAVLVRISTKRRVRSGEVSDPAAGPVKWDIVAVLAAVIVYIALVGFLHEWLIGVPPMPAMA